MTRPLSLCRSAIWSAGSVMLLAALTVAAFHFTARHPRNAAMSRSTPSPFPVQRLIDCPGVGTGSVDQSGGYAGSTATGGKWLQMIDVQEFARRLSTLGPDAFTSDDIVDLATAADVRISADLEIDAVVAQFLLDCMSPAVPVTGAQVVASQWPPPMSFRPSVPAVTFSSPGAVDGPADQPTRSGRSGPARPGRRPGSRRTTR